MIIPSNEVVTREVIDWKGIHLLHFHGSTCSQKVRLMLGELGLDWSPHPVNLMKGDNSTPWFLGINPRGVVPVLVHDGVVHVESNDIITYLDNAFASQGNSYFFEPGTQAAAEAQSLLDREDALHIDLRILTIQFGPLKIKSSEEIDQQERNGTENEQRTHEVSWWRNKQANGISHTETQIAAANFASLFNELDERLSTKKWLMGERLSIVDISLFTNIQRLVNMGYPLDRHPRLNGYYQRLIQRPAFKSELSQKTSIAGRFVFRLVKGINAIKGKRITDFL